MCLWPLSKVLKYHPAVCCCSDMQNSKNLLFKENNKALSFVYQLELGKNDRVFQQHSDSRVVQLCLK